MFGSSIEAVLLAIAMILQKAGTNNSKTLIANKINIYIQKNLFKKC
jgi:hypothetical protein